MLNYDKIDLYAIDTVFFIEKYIY